MKLYTILGLAFATSACVVAPERGAIGAPASSAPVATTESVTIEPVLYARDGTPVSASGSPSFARDTTLDGPAHGVQQSEGSRMYLLELYQEVVDKKEALELEARSLMVELQQAQEKATTLGQELETNQARVTELEATNEEYRAQLRELAARLVTAQIRRFESEKLLLESKIDWVRTRRMLESSSHDASDEGDS
jgi:hypothetical protein